MSQYISTEVHDTQEQCGTNVGWGDLCEWVETLLVDEYPSLHHLCDFGFENDPIAFAQELEQAIEAHTPEDTVRSTAEGLLSYARRHATAEILIVGDGITE